MELSEMPSVDPQLCDGCGLCVSVCRCGAILLVDNIAVITENSECGWCLQCEVICPTKALTCPFEIVLESK